MLLMVDATGVSNDKDCPDQWMMREWCSRAVASRLPSP